MWGTVIFTTVSNVPPEAKDGVVMVGQGVGAQHALALKKDGTIVRWGRTDDFFMPTAEIPADATNIVSVAAGAWHGLALRANGQVIAWGNNQYGQTNVPSSATGIVAIATAWHRCAALRADGQVITWGQGGAFFTQTNLVDIACGGQHMVALTSAGRIVSSGLSQLPPPLTNVAGVGAGSFTAFALMGNGAPVFNTTEADRFVQFGETAYFRMWAIGAQPIGYQWSFNGVPIDGATNSFLAVTNVQLPNIGFYTVTATNVSGSVASTLMGLNVPPLRITRAARLDNSIELDLQTAPGQTYRIESKDDLLDADWRALKDVPGELGTITVDVIDDASASGRRFYRVRRL
jgi:hypothetical protein